MEPFHQGVLSNEGNAFLLRAEESPALDNDWKSKLLCEQTIFEKYTTLESNGFKIQTEIDQSEFDIGLCLMTRHKKENYGNVARAISKIKDGGILVCAGHNDIGVKSIEKNIGKSITIEDKISKNHCRVFWMTVNKQTEIPEEWQAFAVAGNNIKDSEFITRPGVFSWNKIDPGSQFLLEHFPKRLEGKVADFGAGWGFLSHHLLDRYSETIELLDLYENEKLALDCARQNVANSDKVSFNWTDLSDQPPQKNYYNWVVTNPPFHTSSRTDVSLGCKFIENAAKSLTRSGSLLLVANRQLPYESELKERFKKITRVAESANYKIILASHRFRDKPAT